MREAVASVEWPVAVVGDGDDIIAEVDRSAVIIDGNGIIRSEALEVGGIEADMSRQDLADDLELAGIIGPRQHVRYQLGHAVDRADLGARSIGICTHADAHIQRAVAVDEVVATTAFDEVAAVAAQDDVARAEQAHARAEEVLETVDQSDI